MATRRSARTSSATILLPLSLTSLELESLPQRRKRVKRENSTTIDDSNSIMNSLIAEPAGEIRSGLLSEYELTRLENIRRNEQFLSNLGLNVAIVSLDAASKDMEIKPTKRGAPKKTRTLSNIEALSRRSGRVTVERLQAELIKQGQNEFLSKRYESSYNSVLDSNSNQDDAVRVDKGPISFSDGSHHSELFDHIAKFDAESGEHAVTSEMKDYNARLSKMTITEDDVIYMCPSRITAVLVHPNRNKLIVLAGDKEGYVGLWDVNNRTDETGDRVLKHQPHSTNVTRFHCSESDGSKIYSASYDGTIRCWDTNTHAFVMSFDASDKTDTCYTSDCFFASHHHGSDVAAFMGKSDGNIAFADFRASPTCYQWQFAAQLSKVNSIQEHPTNPNLVITTGSSKAGCIRVHDIRKAGKTSAHLVEIDEHSKSINAAFVSGDGEFMVSVSLDNTVRTWSNFILPSSKPVCEVGSCHLATLYTSHIFA